MEEERRKEKVGAKEWGWRKGRQERGTPQPPATVMCSQSPPNAKARTDPIILTKSDTV